MYKGVFSAKILLFVQKCERNFEVGRHSRVGALEVTKYSKAASESTLSSHCAQNIGIDEGVEMVIFLAPFGYPGAIDRIAGYPSFGLSH